MAIGALLMIAVFYAFTLGQVDRRNAQRKGDLSEISRNLESLRSSGQGDTLIGLSPNVYPSTAIIFNTYFSPSGSKYSLGYGITAKDPKTNNNYNYLTSGPVANPGDIFYENGLPCGGLGSTNKGVYRITIGLEGGSFCVDNH